MTVLAAPTSVRRSAADRYWVFLGIVLLGYALFGRGFAYIGVAPAYIGEIALVIGLVVLLRSHGWVRILTRPQIIALYPLVVWGFFRTTPHLGDYKMDAVRDAVIWGYSAFAFICGGLIVAEPKRIPMLLRWFGRYSMIFLLGIPLVFIAYRGAREMLPRWPGSGVYIIQVKEGDVMVHLAGILAFWMSDVKKNVSLFWVMLLTGCFATMGVVDRAGAVSFAAVMLLCLLAKPYHKVAWRSVAMVCFAVLMLFVTNLKIEIPGGKGREISFDQFVTNVRSTFGDTGNEGLDSNKEWRILWWQKIIEDTFNGPYFWTGKGFGINLADDDGFQVNSDRSLRSPHSIHMTMLARMGVPGLTLWAGLNLAWAWFMIGAYFHARRYDEKKWQGVFLFLFAYWMAFVINGSFDVFLEGPMGGIWYWCLTGIGAAAVWAYHQYPELLDDEEDTNHASADRAQLLPAAGWGRPGLPVGTGAPGVVRA
jgi:hypothetical protein